MVLSDLALAFQHAEREGLPLNYRGRAFACSYVHKGQPNAIVWRQHEDGSGLWHVYAWRDETRCGYLAVEGPDLRACLRWMYDEITIAHGKKWAE